MNTAPTLNELRELHKRSTYYVIQGLFKGLPSPYFGWWLYSENGTPGSLPLSEAEQASVLATNEDNSPEARVIAMSLLVRSYLVTGGAVRSALAKKGSPLPRAIILIAPPVKVVDGEVVKTFVLTEHQTFLAESPVVDGGKAVKLADLELLPMSLTHNRPPDILN